MRHDLYIKGGKRREREKSPSRKWRQSQIVTSLRVINLRLKPIPDHLLTFALEYDLLQGVATYVSEIALLQDFLVVLNFWKTVFIPMRLSIYC